MGFLPRQVGLRVGLYGGLVSVFDLVIFVVALLACVVCSAGRGQGVRRRLQVTSGIGTSLGDCIALTRRGTRLEREGEVSHRVRSALKRTLANVTTKVSTIVILVSVSESKTGGRLRGVSEIIHRKVVSIEGSLGGLHPRTLGRKALRNSLSGVVRGCASISGVGMGLYCR